MTSLTAIRRFGNVLPVYKKLVYNQSIRTIAYTSGWRDAFGRNDQITPFQARMNIGLLPGTGQLIRNYSGAIPLTLDLITQRVLLVLKLYDKVDPEKLNLSSHFRNDLGLDSLDHVEVIMAVEDEFMFEIPDAHTDRLMRPSDIIRYVADRFDIYD